MSVSFPVTLLQGTAFKWHTVEIVTEGNHALRLIFIVIICCYIDLPPLIVKPLDVGLMEHIDMQTNYRCHKQYLFHDITSQVSRGHTNPFN